MRSLFFVVIALCFSSCSPEKTNGSENNKTLSADDVSAVLEFCLPDFEERASFPGSDDRFIFRVTPDEHEPFVDRFLAKLKQVGEESCNYDNHRRSFTKYDDDLSFFAISLGKGKNYDIVVSGVFDPGNNRILITVFQTD